MRQKQSPTSRWRKRWLTALNRRGHTYTKRLHDSTATPEKEFRPPKTQASVLTFSSLFYPMPFFWKETLGNTWLLSGKAVQLHSPVPGSLAIQAFFNIFLYWKPAPMFWGIEVNILCDTLSSKIILQKFGIYQKRLIESQQYCTSNKGTGPLFIS